ncbi:hypothetical protein QWY85_02175 [Neolewinella lacunae]|uniref:Uncharacterized protein n=1 Tax=Neolewinella lacunae TaxID=1517758 RepID=A0A923TAY8_9BACT|nr:hypothetical protein [Neolewinella lacunae]MBC6996688.1 hypothetical protein [Neolewinella lacunae]MDN3633447.1 hypothetical protein [Neolewinella lacunae]
MEHGLLTEAQQKDTELIQLLLDKIVKKKGFENICANVEGYETPAKIRRSKDSEEYFIPDCTGEVNGRKSYFELGMKSLDERELVTKWRLLASLATHKHGKLYLAVPRGHMAFTTRILADYPIQAEVVKL